MTTTPTTTRRHWPSSATPFVPRRAEDWEPWKGVFHELYITHNRILKDIIAIMETTYNFEKMPKMYKNQFARWSFFKYTVKKRPRARAAKGRGAHDGRLVVSGHAAVDSILTPIDVDAAQLKHEEVARFDDPCHRYFKIAMDLFDLQENVEGGRVLRLAFLQVERKIAHPTIKSFSDLCFLVPHLLLESGRTDILSAYLRYLTRLASLKFGSHPFTEIAASFVDLLDQPEDIIRYIVLLSQINSDTICNLEDMLERIRLWAQNQYLACLQTKDADASSSKDEHKHPMIRLESQSVYWAQNLIMRNPESDAITEQWLHRNFEPTLPRAKMAAGEVPLIFATMIECLYIGLLNDYYEEMQNWPKYIIWSIHLEYLMRKHGSAKEAEELKQRRKEHVWLMRVRMQVDRLSLT
ncbi:Clr5 domain-containing protein [Podospora didyma]|uniref:Clr5 domain-containing protein n=1 Tax=Podospora didyma TaxID=330526 RepID=A0AAE0JYY0_9PEZI|nr:Clr5 domain-containing protein [Podospora didyma]